MKASHTFKTLFIDDYAIESLDGVSRTNLFQTMWGELR